MNTVVPFPGAHAPRPDVLADAIPIGRPRAVFVYPAGGEWCCFVADENGGSWETTDGTKADALREAVKWVMRCNAELFVENGVQSL